MIGTKSIIAFAVLVIVVSIILEHFRKANKKKNLFQRKDLLLSPAERSFLGVLEQALGDKGRVFSMVRVADVLEPKKGLNRSERTSALNQISSKSFDFVICNSKTMAFLCAIELNDKSHSNKDRRDRDKFLASTCESVGFPLIMIPCRQSYSISEVRESILPYLDDDKLEPTIKADSIRPSDYVVELHPSQRLCPKCHSPLVERLATKGSHAGKKFMACSSYPQCKHIEPI